MVEIESMRGKQSNDLPFNVSLYFQSLAFNFN